MLVEVVCTGILQILLLASLQLATDFQRRGNDVLPLVLVDVEELLDQSRGHGQIGVFQFFGVLLLLVLFLGGSLLIVVVLGNAGHD